ncbi:MAG: hypothetical protein EAZ89_06250 [Bacteroidetes bacterium]|jgi:hypothetical protein|nr:MAG: hypothetical protein EAZ89_06250 [Bacteroidota bacterium]
MKKYLFVLMLLTAGSYLCAQPYGLAVGLRMGGDVGLSVKGFNSSGLGIEGIAQGYRDGLWLTCLAEKHVSALDVRSLYWYYGAGGHLGIFDEDYDRRWYDDDDDYFAFGIDGILGVEYVVREIPFTLSLDWKPAFTFSPWQENWDFRNDYAISVRFRLK